MTAPEGRIVGAEWAREWSQWCAPKRMPETPAAQYATAPLEAWGPHTKARPTVIFRAGPERPCHAETTERLRAAPGPHTGWRGDFSSLLQTPLPPRLVLQTANMFRAAEIRGWGRDAAPVHWLLPEGRNTRLTVVHFRKEGPVQDDATPHALHQPRRRAAP